MSDVGELPHAKIDMIGGLLENLDEHGGRIDIYKLMQALQFELDDLMPITEAAEMLGFASVEEGDIQILDLGQQIIDGDENAKKEIFRRQMVANVGLISHITRELEREADHRVERERILGQLASSFSPQESERQLDTAVDWARYSELFDYDPDAQEFFLPKGAAAE